MTFTRNVLLLAFALVPALANADGSGTLYQEGKPLALKHAYAYRGPDPFEKTQTITTVVFADKPIDAAAANAANDRGEAVEDQLRRAQATRVDLTIKADGSVQNVNINSPGYSGSQSGSGWYTLKLVRNDDKRIEGVFQTNDEADKKEGRYYDLKFALDLAGAPDRGAALPADGGEPAKRIARTSRRSARATSDALSKTMTKERSAEFFLIATIPTSR